MSQPQSNPIAVHLTPPQSPKLLRGRVAVVIDVLRATTTIVQALAAGCTAVYPCLEVEDALRLAGEMKEDHPLLGGERRGKPLPGFDLGNSPREYTVDVCRGRPLVMTTTNGTRALLGAMEADRILVAGFVNLHAVCEHLRQEMCPVHVICAGHAGEIALEDVLVAGAIVADLDPGRERELNDAGRLARSCFQRHERNLQQAMRESEGGGLLMSLGYDEDIRDAAQVNRFPMLAIARRDPLRIVRSSENLDQVPVSGH